MSKQTSVDFLLEEFSEILRNVNFTVMQALILKDADEEARDMHEIEITEAFKEGNLYHGWALKHEPEEYYNKTYKKDK
jgi:uncharacterized protein YfkK (UPF0435 family)